MTLRTVIVDDEPLAVRGLQLSLKKIPDVEIVGLASEGRTGLEVIRRERPDLVLLDISMPLASGIDVARELGDCGAPAVIFVTAFSQFALEAFEVEAIDFVLKPVSPERLRKAVDRARQRIAQTDGEVRRRDLQDAFEALKARLAMGEGVEASVWVNDARGRVRLPVAAIERFEAQRDYVRIHTVRGESFIERGTLGELTASVKSPVFQRVHRSATVNLNHVTALRRRQWGMVSVTLASGVEVPVGRSYVAPLRQRLEESGVMGFRGGASDD